MAQTIHNLYNNGQLETIAHMLIQKGIHKYTISLEDKDVIFDVSYYL